MKITLNKYGAPAFRPNIQPVRSNIGHVAPLVDTCGISISIIMVGPRTVRDNGVFRFLENASMLCAAFQIESRLIAWLPTAANVKKIEGVEWHASPTPPPALLQAIGTGLPLITHNCEFDREAFRKLKLPETPVQRWIDTSALARARVLPEELDRLAQRLGIPTQRDDAAINLQTILNQKISAHTSPVSTSFLQDTLHLALANAATIAAIAERFSYSFLDDSQENLEKQFFHEHVLINERGIEIDLDFVDAAHSMLEQDLSKVVRAVDRITKGVITLVTLRNSNPDVKSSLPAILEKAYGFHLEGCDENCIREALSSNSMCVTNADNPDARHRKRLIRCILLARLRVASAAMSKLEAMRQQTSADKRLRNQYFYHVCHTGRDASRGVQVQNFARPKEGVDIINARHAVVDHRAAILRGAKDDAGAHMQRLRKASGEKGIAAAIASCVPTALVAQPNGRILMADSSQVEPRVLRWLAGDDEHLKSYQDFDLGTGRDPYCIAAEKLVGRYVAGKNENPSDADKKARNVAKICEISLGYQTGADTFEKRCQKEDVDFAAIGLTAKTCVQRWRNEHPKVAGRSGLWETLETTFMAVVQGSNPINWNVHGAIMAVGLNQRDLYARLPSGRCLVYPNTRIEESKKFPGRRQITYDSPQAPCQLYGGLITENIVQAIAADCLRHWILEAARAKIKVIGQTHDEIIAEALANEADFQLDLLLKIMKTSPPWGFGLPVNAAGEHSPYYKK